MDMKRIASKTEKNQKLAGEQIFKWGYNSEDKFTEATIAQAYTHESFGQKYWICAGWTGSHTDENIFYYEFILAYTGEEEIEGEFDTTKGGLEFVHAYSEPNGQLGYARAKSATVNIKFNPQTGYSEGEYKTEFLGIHQSPRGKFYFKP